MNPETWQARAVEKRVNMNKAGEECRTRQRLVSYVSEDGFTALEIRVVAVVLYSLVSLLKMGNGHA